MRKLIEPGDLFGELTAIELFLATTRRKEWWHCVCVCGETVCVDRSSLQSGNKRSCGCLFWKTRRRALVHGATSNNKFTPEYTCWASMLSRCRNKNGADFQLYGGRGVEVCEAWHSFSAFLADMGPRPSPAHSLDRWPDQDGNYTPQNCRWATKKEQSQNRRNVKQWAVGGTTYTGLADACRAAGVHYETARSRIKAGLPPDKIFKESLGRGYASARAARI